MEASSGFAWQLCLSCISAPKSSPGSRFRCPLDDRSSERRAVTEVTNHAKVSRPPFAGFRVGRGVAVRARDFETLGLSGDLFP